MGGVRTSILLRNVDDVMKRLDGVAHAAGDLSPTWPMLARLFEDRQNTVFDTAGLGRWEPFARETIRRHQSPLVDFGVMKEGLTRAVPRFERKRFVVFGPEKHDRRVMNPGVLNTVGTVHMPARPPVPRLRAAERRAWVGVIRAHIHKAVT